MRHWPLLSFVACVALFSCGPSDETVTPAQPKVPKSYALGPLPTDAHLAALELIRRFDKSVKVVDGIAIVRDPLMGQLSASLVPANTPWVMTCGIGTSVVFGTSVSGSGED